jgi:hypothetical protein
MSDSLKEGFIVAVVLGAIAWGGWLTFGIFKQAADFRNLNDRVERLEWKK